MKFKLSRKIIFRSLIVILLVWAFVIPFFFQKTTNETISDIPQPQAASADTAQSEPLTESEPVEISRGTFKGINGQSGSGDAVLLKIGDKHYIRLESNFTVSSGPDLFVSVGEDNEVLELVEKLKGTSGGQNYELPADIDPASFDQVLIHCRAFQYSFSVAGLVKP